VRGGSGGLSVRTLLKVYGAELCLFLSKNNKHHQQQQ
jgi:hypothetical protein